MKPVSVSVQAAGAEGVLLDMAAEAGVSVIVPPELAEKVVTAEFEAVEAQEAFKAVVEPLGFLPVYRGGLVTFVQAANAVRSWAVLEPGFSRPEDAAAAMKQVVGEGGVVTVVGERVMVSGFPEQVDAAEQVAQALQAGDDGWMVEVRLVAVSASLRKELGVDWQVGGAAGVTMDAAAGSRLPVNVPVFGARASVLVDAVLKAAIDGRDAKLLRTGRLFVMEGTAARMQSGEVVPVPRRSVSPEGTVQTVGYDSVETGFTLDVRASRVPGGARMEFEPSLSAITSYVEASPVRQESRVKSSAILRSGDWVVISGLDAKDAEDRHAGVLSWLGEAEKFDVSASSVLVCLQAVRVVSADEVKAAASGVVLAPGTFVGPQRPEVSDGF